MGVMCGECGGAPVSAGDSKEMNVRVFALLLLLPGLAFGQIYKCPKAGGGFDFTDRPCAGAAESPENAISIDARPSPEAERQKAAVKAYRKEGQDLQRQRNVDVPATEMEAAALLSSSDPTKRAIGRQMAIQVQEQKRTLDRLIQLRAEQEASSRRFDEARRRLSQ